MSPSLQPFSVICSRTLSLPCSAPLSPVAASWSPVMVVSLDEPFQCDLLPYHSAAPSRTAPLPPPPDHSQHDGRVPGWTHRLFAGRGAAPRSGTGRYNDCESPVLACVCDGIRHEFGSTRGSGGRIHPLGDPFCLSALVESGHTPSAVPLHLHTGLGDGSSEADWRLLNAGWAYADAVLISGNATLSGVRSAMQRGGGLQSRCGAHLEVWGSVASSAHLRY